MSPQQPYTLIYAPVIKEHLQFVDKKHLSYIRATLLERLSFDPNERNRNRKPLTRPAFEEATWELRFGPENMFRVFYEVKAHEREVHILAFGLKLRDKLFVGGEEIEL